MITRCVLALGLLFAATATAEAADGQTASAGATLLPEKRGAWVNISEGLLADFGKRDLAPIIKFKYDSTNGAGVCGILANRSLPAPWVIIQGRGIWKATDSAPGFERLDGGKYDAFYENAGPDIDPEGRGLCLFSIQGSTINSTCAMTRDAGKTWSTLTTDPQAFGYDLGAVDWAGGGMTILAKKHHNGDLALSRDGGQSWSVLGKGESRNVVLGVIGADVLLKGVRGGDNGGLFRSTDAGSNWTKAASCQFGRAGHVVVFHGVAYVTTSIGVQVSRDRGEHWALSGEEFPGLLGPVMFGKNDGHLMVYGSKGFFESKDAGKTWTLAVPFGDDPNLRSGRFEYGSWNPNDDAFYLTHISGQAFVYRRDSKGG